MNNPQKVAFQGEPGANSHIACIEVYPAAEPVPCATFEDCFVAVESGATDLAMIPIENSVAGRVADIHRLLPDSSLFMIGEHFQPIHHQLVAPKGATLDSVKTVQSHVQALGQCRRSVQNFGLEPVVGADTAGSARMIAEASDPSRAAISSKLAAEIYDLDILAKDIEDEDHNTTRFVIFSKTAIDVRPEDGLAITSFIFRVRNVPAALYKGLGGFATNGVNMTKLESYQLEGEFFATQFYAEVEGHPEEKGVALALEELGFFSKELRVLGTYPAADFRANIVEPEENRDLKPTPGQ